MSAELEKKLADQSAQMAALESQAGATAKELQQLKSKCNCQ